MQPVVSNKKATFEFEILERFDAGIMLTGTEIKSVRQNKVNLSDAFCAFRDGEIYIRNMHIAEYERGNIYNHEPKRDRKLLLKKREMNKLHTKVKEKGLTIIPLKVFFNDRGFAKVEIGLAKGKKIYDKRESIKERDVKRDSMRDYS